MKIKIFNREICVCALLVTNSFMRKKQRRNGENDAKNLPYLMKARHSPKLYKEWYHKLSNIVFVTDKYDSKISPVRISRSYDSAPKY